MILMIVVRLRQMYSSLFGFWCLERRTNKHNSLIHFELRDVCHCLLKHLYRSSSSLIYSQEDMGMDV